MPRPLMLEILDWQEADRGDIQIGMKFEFDRAPLSVGRSPVADLTLASRSISRWHFELFYGDHQWWVQDVGSASGTLLNNRALQDRATLSPGDVLTAGVVLMKVHLYVGRFMPP